MDKAQKELVKSYFHARNIAVEEDNQYYRLFSYEINGAHKLLPKNYILRNDIFDSYNTRLDYLNKNEKKYSMVTKFKFANKKLAMAISTNNVIFFIDYDGNRTINGLTDENMYDFNAHQRAGYFNTKFNVNIYNKIYEFNRFGDITIAELSNKSYIMIDKNNNRSVVGIKDIDIDEMFDFEMAAYFNVKGNRSDIVSVDSFTYANNNVTNAHLTDGKYIFINRDGEELTNGLGWFTDEDYDKLGKLKYTLDKELDNIGTNREYDAVIDLMKKIDIIISKK